MITLQFMIILMSVIAMSTNLKLIKNEMSHEERMQHRIDALYRDLHSGDGDMTYVNDVLNAIHDYLQEYEDNDIFMSVYKIKEAIFYIDNFNNS